MTQQAGPAQAAETGETVVADAARATGGPVESSAPNPFARVLIIGVGLIGGSIAAALKAREDPPVVRGIDIDPQAIATALTQGYLDKGAVPTDKDVDAWLTGGPQDLIILAVPVSGMQDWLERIERSGYAGVLTDVASTKGILCDLAARILTDPARFIPGHPMAGSEVNGLEGAHANLFQGAHWILCPDEHTAPQAFLRLHEFVTSLGARSISVPRNEHDNVVAIVSHVPHMVASALVQLAGDHAHASQEIFRLAAGGFKDTTRIA
ncbi:MAG: prephenate dehydrogenase/arogenate dehydrogenase family protein, partial [Coriobacteriales bacterium]|nr:prephenate dehydrogenase/arogenate dehydrogenase family protein [Coriobacteriales bacterium]